jgi:hypothetical protein
MIVCAIAVGLSGCGSEHANEFQSYGQGETPAVPTDSANVNPQAPESPDDATLAADNSSTRPAFAQPAVEAPVPALVDNSAALNNLAANAAGTTPSPEPADITNPDTTQPVATAAADTAAPREVKILVKERIFEVEGPEDAIRVSFDDIDLLKVINMEPVTADAPDHMPKWLKDLNGKRIRLRGYMYPAFMETGLTSFLIARDTQTCCFGSTAKLYDRFLVRMRKGVTTNYLLRTPFDVVGVFRIEPVMLDGELFQIYQIDDAIVIEK